MDASVRWAVAATVTLVLASAAAIAHRDPSWIGTGLWLASITSVVAVGVVHDRGSRWPRRLLRASAWRWTDTWALVVLGAVALAIRVHRLGSTLPFLHGDEGEMGLLARRALGATANGAAPLPAFGTGFLDHPTLFHYVQAGALGTFGDSVTGLRLLSAGVGALAAPAVYLIARLGWGRAAGVVAGWLLCVSHLHVHYSRLALNNIESASFITTAMALAMVAVTLGGEKEGSSDASSPSLTVYVAFGLTVGVSQYFYYGSRVLLVMAVPTLMVLRRRGWARRRDVIAVVGATTVAAVPLMGHYARHPAAFVNRSAGVSVLSAPGLAHELGDGAELPRDGLRLLARQLGHNVSFFVDSGDRSAFYSNEFAAFDRVTLVLFWLGLVALGAAALRRRPRSAPARLVLTWMVLGVALGGVITNDAPNGPRLLMVVPAVFVCGGVSAQFLWKAANRRRPAWRNTWRGLAVAAALVVLFTNWNRYFVDYAKSQPLAWVTDIATLIRDEAPSHRVFLIGGDALRVDNGVIRFVADGAVPSDLSSAEDFETIFPELEILDRPVLVIALAFRNADLERIEQQHPGGVLSTYADLDGRISHSSYELPG